MARRTCSVAFVATATLADRGGDHRIALYALLAAVAATGLVLLEEVALRVDRRTSLTQPVLWSLVLALDVVGAATRGPAVAEGSLPAAARSALLASLALFCVLAAAALRDEVRRRALERERVGGVPGEVDHRLSRDEGRDRRRERREHRRLEEQLARR